jgi:hypothetical protein
VGEGNFYFQQREFEPLTGNFLLALSHLGRFLHDEVDFTLDEEL